MNRLNMKRRFLVLLGILFALSAMSKAAESDSVIGIAERPTTVIDPKGCVTSECHGEVMEYQVIHGPLAAKECNACHRLTSAEKHLFEQSRQKEKICTFCHEFNTGLLPVLHDPVITGECLGCHNPHGGTDRSLVREATMAKTCGRCHESVSYGRHILHKPVKDGECVNCHRPHAAKYPNLLDITGTKLCFTCHEEFEEQMANTEFLHDAMDEGCVKCHDSHASNYPMQVKQSVPELCLSCHESIKKNMEAKYQHPAILGERACLTCHTPHGSNLSRLMSDLPVNVCMTCHDEEIEMKSGGVVPAMIEISDPDTFKHSPIRDGQCGGCHSIHGGDLPLLLSRHYSRRFYQGFSDDNYSLCFGCHDENMVDLERPEMLKVWMTNGLIDWYTMDQSIKPAKQLTEFRNGDRNLHYVHVAEGEYGRNCSVCHSTHASKYPSLVRDWVQFGKWKMDIRFEKTITGGTCMTGCHPEYSYDRVLPAAYKSAISPAERSPSVPVADKNEAIMIEWAGLDINGDPLNVPAANQPSVLLFLRSDQVQTRHVVEMVSAANPQIGTAQVIVVFCGENAVQNAEEFAAANTLNWFVVTDPDLILSRQLEVEVRPATLVVQEDGILISHMGGASPALTLELKAYLDLAAHKIDRETLGIRLAQMGLVGDGPIKRGVWHLQMGRMLLNEGKFEEARDMLSDGLMYDPDSTELKVEMVRALIELEQAEEAVLLLNKLPRGALPRWERDLLRGRIMAMQGRWEDAARLATEVLKQEPKNREAHHLMGMVYEHNKEWEKAMEEYRAAYTKEVQ